LDFELVVFYVTSPFSTNCFSSAFHSIFTGKRIKTNPISLDFPRDFRLVFIITYGHTYTSNLLSNGAAPKDVQELLGHADVSTTMNIYAHATREAKRTSARLLDKGIGGE
jgi:integrase